MKVPRSTLWLGARAHLNAQLAGVADGASKLTRHRVGMRATSLRTARKRRSEDCRVSERANAEMLVSVARNRVDAFPAALILIRTDGNEIIVELAHPQIVRLGRGFWSITAHQIRQQYA